MPAHVVSLSVGGCGIEVDDPDFALPRQRRVLVRLSLPGRREQLSFWAMLRFSRPRDGSSYHGLQFAAGVGAAADSVREDALRAFVMERQRAELEKRARRAG